MRITDYQVWKCRGRCKIWKRRLFSCLDLELDHTLTHSAVRHIRREQHNINRLKIRRRYVQSCIFNLNFYSDHQCLTDYRFKKSDIVMLCKLFDWPGVTARSEYIIQSVTAMCAFLRRLSTPTRWFDLEKYFGLFASQLSELFCEHVELCVDMFCHTLELRPVFLMDRAATYAQTLVENGSPFDSVIAFIDCTKVQISRPKGTLYNQQAVYSGHKRKHCLTYQSISTPDGLIAALYGPVEGRPHDLTLLRQSGWEDILSEACNRDGRQFYVYGDSAYLLRPYMIRPFMSAFANGEKMAFNSQMSSLRMLIEHNYRDLKQIWTSQNYAG